MVVPRIAPVMFTSSVVAIAGYFYKLKFVKGVVDAALELVDRVVNRVDQALEDNAERLAEVVATVARGACVVTIVDDDEPDQTELESAVAELEQQIAEANALGEETGPVEKILEEVRLELESVRSRKGPR